MQQCGGPPLPSLHSVPTVWTIGYERLLPPALVAELEHARIERVIDVRYRPQSRRPGMSKTRLGELLADHRIAYEHRRALGTPPDIRWLFKANRIPEARAAYRRHVEQTAAHERSRSWPRSSTTARAPRCCAWRESRRHATGACSPRR